MLIHLLVVQHSLQKSTRVTARIIVARQTRASFGVPDAEGQAPAAADLVPQDLCGTLQGAVSSEATGGTNWRNWNWVRRENGN